MAAMVVVEVNIIGGADKLSTKESHGNKWFDTLQLAFLHISAPYDLMIHLQLIFLILIKL